MMRSTVFVLSVQQPHSKLQCSPILDSRRSAIQQCYQLKLQTMQNITESELSRHRGSHKPLHPSPKQLSAEDRFGFKTFRRSPPRHPPFYHPKQKLNISCASQQPERRRTPSPSALSAQQQEYYRSIQNSLLCENRNLKEHNNFLLSQIRGHFEHDKRQNQTLARARRECKELQRANLLLQQQLETLTGHTLSEIERIQGILRSERWREDELIMSSQSSPRRSDGMELETEETVNNNLEELKQKVKSILYDSKHIVYSPNHHKRQPQDEALFKCMALDTQNSIREKVSKQTKQLKITEATAKNTTAPHSYDEQLPSPRSSGMCLPYSEVEQRRSCFKR